MKTQAVKRPRWWLRLRLLHSAFMADRYPYWRDSLDALVFLAFMAAICFAVYVGGWR